MPQPTLVEIPFPVKGLHENAPASKPPELTTPVALNVRPSDTIAGRERGGQRPGLVKYFAEAINGTNAIQALCQVTSALDPDTFVADQLVGEDTFTYADGFLHELTTDWTGYTAATASVTTKRFNSATGATQGLIVTSGTLRTSSANPYYSAIFKSLSYPSTETFIIQWTTQRAGGTMGTVAFFGVAIRIEPVTAKTCLYLEMVATGILTTNTTVTLNLYRDDGGRDLLGTGTITIPGGLTVASKLTWQFRVNGNAASVWCNGIWVWDLPSLAGEYESQGRIGIVINNAAATDNSWRIDDWKVYTALFPASRRTTHICVVSGGSIYAGTPDLQPILMTGGSSVLHTSLVPIGVVAAFGKLYTCDGQETGYFVVDPVLGTASSWIQTVINSGEGMIPVGSSNSTAYDIDGVNQGTKTFTISETVVLTDGAIIEVTGSTDGNNGFYSVASTNGTTNIVVDQAIPDPGHTGSIVVRDLGCRIICLYRGRIVMSGLQSDPHNWFMSAVGDPNDWDYAPATTSATMAVAGNASEAGELGDVVTALIPHSDDMLVIGGDHTIWVMRGDPAAGGVIDAVSFQTGIVGPEAYAYDPEGNLYFFGSGQLWRMDPGATTIQSISGGRLDTTFAALNYATHHIRMAWDQGRSGLHIFVTPVDQATTTHYWYDQGSDSIWSDQFPAAHGPTAAATYDADNPDDRALLLGGFDSYIRTPDDASATDDGTPVQSYVDFTPVIPNGDALNSRLIWLQPILADDSGSIKLKVFAAATADELLDETTPVVTKTITQNRSGTVLERVSGNAFRIRLHNDDSVTGTTWAFESAKALFKPTGRQRYGRL